MAWAVGLMGGVTAGMEDNVRMDPPIEEEGRSQNIHECWSESSTCDFQASGTEKLRFNFNLE